MFSRLSTLQSVTFSKKNLYLSVIAAAVFLGALGCYTTNVGLLYLNVPFQLFKKCTKIIDKILKQSFICL